MIKKLHEECGIFGIFSQNTEENVTGEVYTALYALQHRGQESCGIAVNKNGEIYLHKDLGLVNVVFNEMILGFMHGSAAIGHVRYSTSKSVKNRDNAQPYVTKHIKGQIGIAHNGALTNATELRQELSKNGALFQSTSYAEIIAYIVAQERLKVESTEQAIINAMSRLEGSYSLVVLTTNKLIAARDPMGFRPLCMGELDDGSIVFASESCAIDSVGGKFIRDIEPGEVVVVSREGITSLKYSGKVKSSLCIFEHIYFARPDSVIDGVSVHNFRVEAGKILARINPVKADVVIGVPDSGLDAALGYSRESGIPYATGLIKNRYVARTFIEPGQGHRENVVKLKLNPVSSIVKGKRIVLVDDSIVRGTTSENIVKLLLEAGAKEVHYRVSSPVFKNTCYYGMDIESADCLIANRLSVEEIRVKLGAATLEYLPISAFKELTKNSKVDFCDACFSGNYPTKI